MQDATHAPIGQAPTGQASTAMWDGLRALPVPTLTGLFDDEPDRLARMVIGEAGLRFDFAKTHLSRDMIDRFVLLAEAQGFAARRDALFAGDVVNPGGGRAAGHVAERGQGAPDAVAAARALHARMRGLIDAIEAGAIGPFRHILHIGTGGCALGPDLLIDALGDDADRYDVAVVSNIDGMALDRVFRRFDAAATLVVIASKTFATAETMLNAESALAWLADNGVGDPYGQVVALTAAPERAVAWGVDETRILPFDESVGGRYSIWSSIGFTVALALGWDAFETLLEGAAAMDRHFRLSPLLENASLIAAFVDCYYAVVRGAETRAVFAHDERLALLPSYLQQLEMESNGKRVALDGTELAVPSAPILWGGVGTDAQHAVFRMLHQGTHLVPVEFVAVIEPGDALDDAHHEALLIDCFAQGAALMAGQADADAARACPGDRPSTTILIDRLDPARLGALLAFYEQRVFANAVLLGINPFDEWGVEPGKTIARTIVAEGTDRLDASTQALMARVSGAV